jgi:hypothetical protein
MLLPGTMDKNVQLSDVLKELHYMLLFFPESNISIRVRNLSKRYQIGGSQENYLIPLDAVVNFCGGAVQAIPSCSSF